MSEKLFYVRFCENEIRVAGRQGIADAINMFGINYAEEVPDEAMKLEPGESEWFGPIVQVRCVGFLESDHS